MKRLLIECVGILMLAMVVGILVNMLNPSGIPLIGDWSVKPLEEGSDGITVIGLDTAYTMWQSEEALFIDARTPSEFAFDRIPGAINVPRGNPVGYFEALKNRLNLDTPIVVYCSSKDCEDSSVIARFLKENGYSNLYLYEEGIIAWDIQGYPLEK